MKRNFPQELMRSAMMDNYKAKANKKESIKLKRLLEILKMVLEKFTFVYGGDFKREK